jgi:hypothetical protein
MRSAALADYRLVSPRLVYITSLIVMCAELVAAAELISPTTRSMCRLVGSCMMLLYAIAIAINFVRGRRNVHYGCSWRSISIIDIATSGAGVLVPTLLYASIDLLLSRPDAL